MTCLWFLVGKDLARSLLVLGRCAVWSDVNNFAQRVQGEGLLNLITALLLLLLRTLAVPVKGADEISGFLAGKGAVRGDVVSPALCRGEWGNLK
jgi:hypothetical protein